MHANYYQLGIPSNQVEVVTVRLGLGTFATHQQGDGSNLPNPITLLNNANQNYRDLTSRYAQLTGQVWNDSILGW